MRPVFIRAKGFRSYGNLDLDLSGISSLLIFGPKGAGKSSILDAMLWALTGKSTSADSRGHVRLGADLCQVEFGFTHAGSLYRAIRSTSLKNARGKSDLQLAVSDGNGGWTPKGGKGIDETEAEIERIIGMGYEGLTCGPFSLQDQAGKFLDPPELRIDGKVYRGRSARLQVFVKMMGLSGYEQFRGAATTEARDLDAKAGVLEAQVAAAGTALAGREESEFALSQAETTIQTARQVAQEAQGLIEALTGQVGTLQAEIEAGRRQCSGLAADQKALADLGASRLAKEATKTRYQGILEHRAEIEAKAGERDALTASILEIDDNISSVRKGRDAVTATNAEAQKKRGEILAEEGKTKARADGLLPIIQGHEKRTAVMGIVPCIGTGDLPDRCPLLKDARESLWALPELKTRHATLCAWERPALPDLQPTGALDAELVGLEQTKRQAQADLAALARWVSLLPEIALAERELPGIEADLTRIGEQVEAVSKRIEEERTIQADLAVKEKALATYRGDLEGQRIMASRYRADESIATEAAAKHRAALIALDELSFKREVTAIEAASLRSRHSLLVALAEAYCQIPVMILETMAVPILEEEVNKALLRYSPNKAQVRIETQREIKSRDTLADGLEIYVRDVVGERPIDSYSGGQRFDLFLAFRVGLAKLQARRSGVGVECLIVDEGFGSQDAGSLGEMIAALQEMQKDFPLLVVISHVEAMKDVFPTRLEVSGGPEDSRAELVAA